jgi:NADH-quinone oxidoreductase subunit H
MTVVTVVLITGSLSTRAIVESQNGGVWDWNLIRLGVVPFVLFMVSITAELTRPPFDLTEADSELVGGFNTEYSSIRFAMFFLAEFMNTVTMSAVVVTLFLGGPNGPIPRFIPTSDVWMPIIWFVLKTLVFLFVYVWLRAALPRLRYDQLMDLGWKRLIPLTLGWLMLVAAIVIWHWWGLFAIGVIVVAGVVLKLALRVGADRSESGAFGEGVGMKVTPSSLYVSNLLPPAGEREPGPSQGAR